MLGINTALSALQDAWDYFTFRNIQAPQLINPVESGKENPVTTNYLLDFAKFRLGYSKVDCLLLQASLEIAQEAHSGQTRKTGTSYFEHHVTWVVLKAMQTMEEFSYYPNKSLFRGVLGWPTTDEMVAGDLRLKTNNNISLLMGLAMHDVLEDCSVTIPDTKVLATKLVDRTKELFIENFGDLEKFISINKYIGSKVNESILFFTVNLTTPDWKVAPTTDQVIGDEKTKKKATVATIQRINTLNDVTITLLKCMDMLASLDTDVAELTLTGFKPEILERKQKHWVKKLTGTPPYAEFFTVVLEVFGDIEITNQIRNNLLTIFTGKATNSNDLEQLNIGSNANFDDKYQVVQDILTFKRTGIPKELEDFINTCLDIYQQKKKLPELVAISNFKDNIDYLFKIFYLTPDSFLKSKKNEILKLLNGDENDSIL
jgi:hypothetical protein